MTERSIFDVSDLKEIVEILVDYKYVGNEQKTTEEYATKLNELISQRIKAEVEKVLVQFGKELKENKWEALGQNNVALSDVLKKLEELKKRLGLQMGLLLDTWFGGNVLIMNIKDM